MTKPMIRINHQRVVRQQVTSMCSTSTLEIVGMVVINTSGKK